MEFVLVPIAVFALIAIHEMGHYAAGLTAGIPAKVMRIRLLTFPQHVALWDGERWVSPIKEMEHFIEVSRRYLGTRSAAFRWVVGGLIAETGFTIIACILAVQLGWQSVAFWIAITSLAMYLINVVLMDIPWAMIYGHVFGDTSGLWGISRLPALVVTAFMLAIRLVLVWYVTR